MHRHRAHAATSAIVPPSCTAAVPTRRRAPIVPTSDPPPRRPWTAHGRRPTTLVSPERRRSHHDLPRKHVSNADQRKPDSNRSALRPRIHNLVTQLRSTRGELLGHNGDLSRLCRLVVVVAGRERCLISRYT